MQTHLPDRGEFPQDMAEATNTRRDGQGAGRDTDIDGGLPLQAAPMAITVNRQTTISPSGQNLSLILMFAEHVQQNEPQVVEGVKNLSHAITNTFGKERGGERDTDMDQMDYAAIGVKSR